jgi:iron complex outermembrane receptor protein
MKTKWLANTVAWSLLAIAPHLAAAQATGTVEGRVTAARGGPIGGAEVSVLGTEARAMTDSDGRYRLVQVPTGTRALIAHMIGYGTQRRSITVNNGQSVTVDLTLVENPVAIDGIMVTANRTLTELKDVPASAAVVTAADIQAKLARYQGDELIGISGVRVLQEEFGEWTSVQIRGVPSRHHNDTFLALVDGIPFVTGNDEVSLEDLVPTAVVQRVEVVKGPVSALYGRGGMTGAVNYITKTPAATGRLDGGVFTGSYGYIRPWLGGTLDLGANNQLYFNAFHDRLDGWRDGTDRKFTSAFAKDHWQLSPTTSLSILGNYQKREQGIGGLVPLRDNGEILPVAGGIEANYNVDGADRKSEIRLGSAVLESRLSPRTSFRLTTHFRAVDSDADVGFYEGFDESAQTINFNGFRGVNQQRMLYAEPQLNFSLGNRVRLIAGASYERINGNAQEYWTGEYGLTPSFDFYFYLQRKNYQTGQYINRAAWITEQLSDFEYTANVWAGYAQAEVDITSRLFATLGARFDRFQRSADYAAITAGGETTPAGSNDDHDSHVSPKVALSLRMTDDITGYASFGEGFSPAFGPVWAFREREKDLLPELARNYELGLKGVLNNGRLGFSLAAYRLDRSDLLVLIGQEGEASPKPANAGGQRSIGIELDLQSDLSAVVSGMSAFGSFTYTNSKWTDNRFVAGFDNTEFDFTDKNVAGVPERMFTIGLGQRFGNYLNASAWLNHTGRYWIDADNTVRSSGYSIFNATATVTPPALHGVGVQLTVQNLLDEEYANYYGGTFGPSEAAVGRPRQLIVMLRYNR